MDDMPIDFGPIGEYLTLSCFPRNSPTGGLGSHADSITSGMFSCAKAGDRGEGEYEICQPSEHAGT